MPSCIYRDKTNDTDIMPVSLSLSTPPIETRRYWNIMITKHKMR
ncbi:hypothetical protein SAMN05661012_06654 [Chitinophaga sancti]|uniref:Uncharacterized protein n=1 Tax=Chitinophaga sancti TaxID=1004 RepID=A0A1K1T236_9BACT|nr:hypothetical protein SAMN05661012_06654 [Chitinophaga sancti]